MQKPQIELPIVKLTERNFPTASAISMPEVTREGNNWVVTIFAPTRDAPSVMTKYQGCGKDKVSAVMELLSNVRARNVSILISVCRQIQNTMPEIESVITN